MLAHQLEKKAELARVVGQKLTSLNATVTTVESCTGGGLAYAITQVAGASGWINQSWITYSNDAKHSLVGVELDTLERHGAVSQPCVTQMAEGGMSRANAEFSVAISGIAGPTGGSVDKPVGLVWFAIATKNETMTFRRCFSGNREIVREQAIVLALEKLIQCLDDFEKHL